MRLRTNEFGTNEIGNLKDQGLIRLGTNEIRD